MKPTGSADVLQVEREIKRSQGQFVTSVGGDVFEQLKHLRQSFQGRGRGLRRAELSSGYPQSLRESIRNLGGRCQVSGVHEG